MPRATGYTPTRTCGGGNNGGARGSGGRRSLRFCKEVGARASICIVVVAIVGVLAIGSMVVSIVIVIVIVVVVVGCVGSIGIAAEHDGSVEGRAGRGHVPGGEIGVGVLIGGHALISVDRVY